jgi:hypothetical protein
MTDASTEFEPVLTVWDYCDGPRSGVAMYKGQPHVYRSLALDIDSNDADDLFVLQPIDSDTLTAILEDWRIWERWQSAHLAGVVSSDTHPALPEDRIRHEKLKRVLDERLAIPAVVLHARAVFRGQLPDRGSMDVSWTTVMPWGTTENSA